MARLELAASWSQTRRPTNWATPGYKIKRKCSLWSNMWSRKFYHSFAKLSTEIIRGIGEDKGEYAIFREVEPFWCSSSQTRRPFLLRCPASSLARTPASSADRSHALGSLIPPPAVVASFANWATPGKIVHPADTWGIIHDDSQKSNHNFAGCAPGFGVVR